VSGKQFDRIPPVRHGGEWQSLQRRNPLMRLGERLEQTTPFLLILLASLAAVFPLVLRGPSCGHDFDFHLLSWIEAATDWRKGLVYPHWLVTANYGAGEPRFIFYPPVSWFLGAALGGTASLILGQHGGWTVAPILLTWISILVSGCAVYALAREFASGAAATLGACLFVANPYLLFVAYERTAYAELLSTAFIALLLLLALRQRIAVVPLALVVAALWLTNAPAAVMGCYTLAVVAFLRMILERSFRPAWRVGLSCGAGIALAGFYLVPAAFEQRWVQIERAIDPGMRVEESFLFEHTGQPYHDAVLHTASVITVVLVCVGLLAAAFAWRYGSQEERKRKLLGIFTALLLGLLFLQLRVSDFIWHLASRLQFLQFPWRWLVVIGIAAAGTLALAMDWPNSGVVRRRALLLLAPIVIAASIWACSHNFYLPCDVDDAVSGQLTMFRDGSGVQGTDEYTARDADNSEVLQDIPQVRVLTNVDAELPSANAGDNPEWVSDFYFPTTAKAKTIVRDWSPQHRRIQIDADQQAFAVLTLMDYPAWQITLNGAVQTNRPHREDGLIALAIPAGRSTIDVRWRDTPDIYLGWALSGFAGLGLGILWLIDRRKRRSLHSDPGVMTR
jgi:hypothetical protein